jgi:hypothetical protein
MADFLFAPGLLVGRANGLRYERENKSEDGVSVPPALIITDSDGAAWTLGTQYVDLGGGEYEFNVLRNDVDIGETAMRIEYCRGAVRIFGKYAGGRGSWKTFSRNRRHFV